MMMMIIIITGTSFFSFNRPHALAVNQSVSSKQSRNIIMITKPLLTTY